MRLFLKIKRTLAHSYYTLLLSYLTVRLFQIEFNGDISEFYTDETGVPHRSVLKSIHFLVYTYYIISIKTDVEAAVFTDYTALFARINDPVESSEKLQAV